MAETRRHYKGTEYKTTLLRRSYREGGKVRNETVGNLSHLEEWVIDGIKAMLAGKKLVDFDDEFEIVRRCRTAMFRRCSAWPGSLI